MTLKLPSQGVSSRGCAGEMGREVKLIRQDHVNANHTSHAPPR